MFYYSAGLEPFPSQGHPAMSQCEYIFLFSTLSQIKIPFMFYYSAGLEPIPSQKDKEQVLIKYMEAMPPQVQAVTEVQEYNFQSQPHFKFVRNQKMKNTVNE